MADEDSARFEKVIVPHLDDAYTLARYLLRDPHDAQDAVQESALRALRYFDGFRGGDPKAWLLTIVRNCCYGWAKGTRADRSVVSFADAGANEIADVNAADDAAIQSSESARVRAAVDALPAELREVIVLRELNDLSYREISEVVGVPMGTVMSRLSRARARLADALGDNSKKAS